MILWTVFAQHLTGHRRLWLERCGVMVAIFSPFFFCETNVSETQSADRSFCKGSVCLISVAVPSPRDLKKRTCSIVIIFVYLPPPAMQVVEYSHDRRAKNSAPVVSVDIAVVRGSVESVMNLCQNARGRQAWLFLGGSLFL